VSLKTSSLPPLDPHTSLFPNLPFGIKYFCVSLFSRLHTILVRDMSYPFTFIHVYVSLPSPLRSVSCIFLECSCLMQFTIIIFLDVFFLCSPLAISVP